MFREFIRIILLLHVRNMWKGANASTVSEEHAISMLLMLTAGTMIASSSKGLAIWSISTQCWHPKPERTTKFTSLEKLLNLRKLVLLIFRTKQNVLPWLLLDMTQNSPTEFTNFSQKPAVSIRVYDPSWWWMQFPLIHQDAPTILHGVKLQKTAMFRVPDQIELLFGVCPL